MLKQSTYISIKDIHCMLNTQSICISVSGLGAVTPPRAAQQSHGPLHSIQNTSSIVEETIISSRVLKIYYFKMYLYFK